MRLLMRWEIQSYHTSKGAVLKTDVISWTSEQLIFLFVQTKLLSDVCSIFFCVWPLCKFQPICVSFGMSGVCVKDRWRELLQVTQPHTDDHVTLFNDLHFLMVSLGAKESDTSWRLLEGLQELAKWVLHQFLPSVHTSTLLLVLHNSHTGLM